MKIFTTILALLLGPFLFAQREGVNAQQTPSASVGSANTRTVVITALSKDGSAGELSAADLEIKEGDKPAHVVAVHKLERLPLHFCLLFDASKSETQHFKLQQNEALDFLAGVIKPGVDQGFVLIFNDEGSESDETKDPALLAKVIAEATPSGGTSLNDAVGHCAHRMTKNKTGQELLLMFLFTDGEENASHISHVEATDLALKAGLRIYAVAPREVTENGERALSWFTKLTGGRMLRPSSIKDSRRAADLVASDLNALVEITYRVSENGTDDRPRDLRIKSHAKGVTILAPEKHSAGAH